MNFIIKNIVIEKKIVAKVFKFKKNKIKGVKFFTPNTDNFQIGLMSHVKNHEIKPHYHLIKKRTIKQMSELLIIFSGKLKVFFYNKKMNKEKSTILNEKDMILLIRGGHGFKVLKKIQMLEIKQGPFLGDKDKIRFDKF